MKFGTHNPAANPDATVRFGTARFTVLTAELIRLEWSPAGTFEDRATLAFINRYLPVPEFKALREGRTLILQTARLRLTWIDDGRAFHPDNLKIESTAEPRFVWTPGTPDRGNLGGTVRTLDGVSGECPLDPGLLSRDGWTLYDDSAAPVIDPGTNWPVARAMDASLDWYFFGYGHEYKKALRDFMRVSGRLPLPPRYAFGIWWSRYWAYTDTQFKEIVEDFRRHDVPLDVLVIDMDWHLDGWTGYTWNPRCFPEPQEFLDWCHEQGLRITLNLHPADGVGRHEAMFHEMKRAMGITRHAVYRIPFDCTDPAFVDAYFKVLHHPLEEQGVDFWWMDWQQGTESSIPGLDPLFWLNHLHWQDMEQSPHRQGLRPLIFSRWGGLGNHRYQIGFSGDTFNDWESLAFQPRFTATAGNVGYGYWSHDIGGHQPGPVAPELYARWIQFGAFSPILRTHAGNRKDAERRIWKFPEEVFSVARDAFRMRYELLPYLYTSARIGCDSGLSLCRPLYYEWPEHDDAYNCSGEYLFGDDLLVAPVTRPVNETSRCAPVDIWLPPGEWFSWFGGERISGPALIHRLVPLDEIPIFVRAAAIIPTQQRPNGIGEAGRTDEKPVTLHIFPVAQAGGRLYEDDGLSDHYMDGAGRWTQVSATRRGAELLVRIDPADGAGPASVAHRQFVLLLRDHAPIRAAIVNGQALNPADDEQTIGWTDDQQLQSSRLVLPILPVDQAIEVQITCGVDSIDLEPAAVGLRRLHRLLHAAKSTCVSADAPSESIDALLAMNMPTSKVAPVAFRRECAQRWLDVVQSVAQCASDPERSSTLCRLLGLSAEMALAHDPEHHDRLAATIVVQFEPPIELQTTFDVTVSFEQPYHWRLNAEPVSSGSIRAQQRREFRTTLIADDAATSDVLRAHVMLRFQGDELIIPFEQHFLPSINAWWVVGPFDSPHERAMMPAFAPEERVDLREEMRGKDDQRLVWRLVTRPSPPAAHLHDEFFINFHEVLGERHDDAVAYALTYAHAPAETDAVLAIGSDDGFVLWINGNEVHRHHVKRGYHSREDRIPIHLARGANAILLKVGQDDGEWGFCAHLETPEGRPCPEIRISPTP